MEDESVTVSRGGKKRMIVAALVVGSGAIIAGSLAGFYTGKTAGRSVSCPACPQLDCSAYATTCDLCAEKFAAAPAQFLCSLFTKCAIQTSNGKYMAVNTGVATGALMYVDTYADRAEAQWTLVPHGNPARQVYLINTALPTKKFVWGSSTGALLAYGGEPGSSSSKFDVGLLAYDAKTAKATLRSWYNTYVRAGDAVPDCLGTDPKACVLSFVAM